MHKLARRRRIVWLIDERRGGRGSADGRATLLRAGDVSRLLTAAAAAAAAAVAVAATSALCGAATLHGGPSLAAAAAADAALARRRHARALCSLVMQDIPPRSPDIFPGPKVPISKARTPLRRLVVDLQVAVAAEWLARLSAM